MGAIEWEQIVSFTNGVTKLARLERFLLIRYTLWSTVVMTVPEFGPSGIHNSGKKHGCGVKEINIHSSVHHLLTVRPWASRVLSVIYGDNCAS